MTLNISGITVEVSRKKIKNMHLHVKPPDGRVTVSAPMRMSNAAIERFVRGKIDWIREKVAKFQNQQPPSEYITGEKLRVWGKVYDLLVENGSRNVIALTENTAVLTVKPGATIKQREHVVREWYRGLLKAETTRLLPEWEKITGLKTSGWQTKIMKTRWGTCNTTTGKIWLNVLLAAKPPECLEYVLLHELVHLAEPNHGAAFKALMDSFMPHWREVRKALNDRS